MLGGGVVGSIGSLKGGGGSWGSWGCHKPGTPSPTSSHPTSSSRTAWRKDIGSERRRAGGKEREKVFAKGREEKKKKFALLAGGPGSRPGGLGRREGWGPGWGGGVALELTLQWPCRPPLPAAHPPPPAQFPTLDHASRALRPDGGERGAGGETTWERWGRGLRRCSDA